MVTAFVLANCEPGSEKRIKNEISIIPEVIDIDITYGAYDIVFKIETIDKKSLVDIILNDIRGISNIKETQTLPIFS
jgi:DNA-binding Lrp family transcriptional regulator